MIADEVLVKKTQCGDIAAFGELVRRYQDKIYNLTAKMLGTSEDALDASQEIFIKIFRSLPGFDFRSSFSTWLYRVSTNVCLDLLRRRGREQINNLSPGGGNLPEENIRDNRPGPEEMYLEREKIKELKRAVEALPDSYRVALVLHHYQELSYKQVAEVMDLPENTVATRIYRAKMMLREKLVGGEGGALPGGKNNVKQLSGRKMSLI